MTESPKIEVRATRPQLMRLPAHLLRANDVIYFPPTSVDGTPLAHEHKLAIVIAVEGAESAAYLDGESVKLFTQGYDGGWFEDVVDQGRMFELTRETDWLVSHEPGVD